MAILLGSIVICYTALWVTYKPQAKYNKGILFGVTLPSHAMDHAGIGLIQARFNKQFRNTSLWLGTGLIPYLLLYWWAAYQTVYFFAWFSVILCLMVKPFRRAFRDTLALKRENGWFVGKKRVIQSDLRVARLKNEKAASPWLFIFPLGMSAGLMLWAWRDNFDSSLIASAGALLLTVLFLCISLLMRRAKAKVYSGNSEVNLGLNQAKRRMVSYMWLWLAIVETLHCGLLCVFLSNGDSTLGGVWWAVTLLFSMVPAILVLLIYRRISTLEQDVLAQDGKTIYSDDDEYWANGFTYHNPNDTSILVPKRIGIGEAINTGTWTGKIVMGGLLGLFAVVVVGVSFMLIRSELTSPALSIMPGHKVEIDYPMYNYSFNMADIEQLTLIDQLPSGSKSNGEATDKYARGKFHLKGLGSARLYVYKKHPPYIQIKLKDTYIIYNDKDPAVTKQLLERLQEGLAKQ
ncbi:DUF5808 domain-containing protein [Paenibacillus sp. MMS18-CY102]|uniref:DUF5808 domain-containing protein n=1 Tax=Paenibacillus sp. MMS18-CY102 TaxID=2682849 RepID=UPI001F3AEC52|nr:DUF5808 domain-containing protein [Paenibacillus sp. MMS18-CY102]